MDTPNSLPYKDLNESLKQINIGFSVENNLVYRDI